MKFCDKDNKKILRLYMKIAGVSPKYWLTSVVENGKTTKKNNHKILI
jgi:hypothetical protein